MLVLSVPVSFCYGYLYACVVGISRYLGVCVVTVGTCVLLCVTVRYCGYLCEYWEVSFSSVRHVLGFGVLHISFPIYRNGFFIL